LTAASQQRLHRIAQHDHQQQQQIKANMSVITAAATDACTPAPSALIASSNATTANKHPTEFIAACRA
jgi:hypothetical protein